MPRRARTPPGARNRKKISHPCFVSLQLYTSCTWKSNAESLADGRIG